MNYAIFVPEYFLDSIKVIVKNEKTVTGICFGMPVSTSNFGKIY